MEALSPRSENMRNYSSDVSEADSPRREKTSVLSCRSENSSGLEAVSQRRERTSVLSLKMEKSSVLEAVSCRREKPSVQCPKSVESIVLEAVSQRSQGCVALEVESLRSDKLALGRESAPPISDREGRPSTAMTKK